MEHFDWYKGFLFPYINFAIFLFFAIKFFKKPIRDMVSARRRDFERLVNEAGSARALAEGQAEELKRRLAKLDSEIETIKTRSREAAEAEVQNMLTKAKNLAATLQEEAKRMAESEVKLARDQLRREIVAEVTSVVTKRLREVSDQEHSVIVKNKINAVRDLRSGV